MKVLIIGARGQLGQEAHKGFVANGDEVVAVGRAELDLGAPSGVAEAVAAQGADWIINCAAYTQVDKAEDEADLAMRINRDGAAAVAEGARQSGSRLLHLSTDFIFAGDRSRPYPETEPGAPLNAYGRSKWAGEQAVLERLPEALILRTAWVYGAHGPNFVKTLLRLMAEREEIRVVDDQIGTPTWTADIVAAMRTLIAKHKSGTWHFTNEGVASWYDFAHAIIRIAAERGHPRRVRHLRPIASADYACAAQRPPYSVLDKTKIRRVLGYEIPHWRDSLTQMLTEVLP